MTPGDPVSPGSARIRPDTWAGDGEHLAVEAVGAFLLGGADPADDAVLERHIGRCPTCAAEAHAAGSGLETGSRAGSFARPDEHRGSGGSIGASWDNDDNERPDALARLLAAARARRPARQPTVPHAAGYADRVAVAGRVLAEFTDPDWNRPTVEGWSARELVGHLAAADELVVAALGSGSGTDADRPTPSSSETAESWTRRTHEAQRSWSSDDVRKAWERTTRRLCDAAAQAHVVGSVPLVVGGMPGTVADHLVDRAFETWIHSRDLAHLVGVTVPHPSPPLLRTMADLALRHLHQAWLNSRPDRGGVLEVELTGTGGGRWLLTPRGVTDTQHRTSDRAPAGTVTASAVEFCLLVADRLDVGALATEVRGDEPLVRSLLFVAPSLARP